MKHGQAVRRVGILCCAWLCAGQAFGQIFGGELPPIGEPGPAIPSECKELPFTFKLGGSVGAATITNPATGKSEIYNTVSLQPEFGLGKFGLGLDLFVYFDSAGRVRGQDWNKTSDLVNKISYARWGRKGDPLYARFGGLSGATLGHGFIMGGYTNRLRYPDVRQVGGELDFDLGYGGVESILTDLHSASLFGGRAYLRPLHGTDLPLLRGLAFGLTGVVDKNPDSDKSTRNDSVGVYGVDAELPIFKNDLIQAKFYGDAAEMQLGSRYTNAGVQNKGKGYMAGFGGKVLFVDYRAEMRSVDANFVPNFFDSFYEIDRSTAGALKADRIPNSTYPRRIGPLAELGVNLFDLVRADVLYESLNYDPLGVYPRVIGELRTSPTLFLGKAQVAAQYERRRLNKFGDISRTHNTDSILTTEISYLVNAGLRMTVVMKETYDEFGQPLRTTQMRADVRF